MAESLRSGGFEALNGDPSMDKQLVARFHGTNEFNGDEFGSAFRINANSIAAGDLSNRQRHCDIATSDAAAVVSADVVRLLVQPTSDSATASSSSAKA